MVISRKFHSIEIQKKNMRKAMHFGPKRTGVCCSIYDRGLERHTTRETWITVQF